MSGTYQIDGLLISSQPLVKRWQQRKIGMKGNRKPVFGPYWNLDLVFPVMDFGTGSAGEYLMQHWLDDEFHSAVLPHPVSGFLTIFSGVVIDDVSMGIMDIDRDGWVDNVRMRFGHISLENSWPIAGQSEWWIQDTPTVGVGIFGSGSYSS